MRNFHRRTRRILGLFATIALAACTQHPATSSVAYIPGVNASGVKGLANLSYRLLHNFGEGNDGSTPIAGLTLFGGKLYGTTQYGGRGGNGTIFVVTPGGLEKVLHSFGMRPAGEQPVGGLTVYNNVLYGTTELGGTSNLGTVFTFDPATDTVSTIHDFSSGNDGAYPTGNLIAFDGALYGTTTAGGIFSGGKGTAFRISVGTTKRDEKVIHSFGSGSDGATPFAGLTKLGDALYGTTTAGGGSSNDGIVFKLKSNGIETPLLYFNCGAYYGKDPVAGLAVISGTLYGATYGLTKGGGSSCTDGEYGTAYSVSSGGSLRTLYSFGVQSGDGESPAATLLASRGVLYGTTYAGGAYSAGILFTMSAAGKEDLLRSFGNETDGQNPTGQIVRMGRDFYGTTSAGGKYGGGTAYTFSL